jgi:sulfatase modifying factor 1
MSRTISLLAASAVLLFSWPPASAVTINWSPVGNPGNAIDPIFGSTEITTGAVPYVYNIGTYDVTVSQYVEFLNIKDSAGANSLGLYNTFMSDMTYGGIDFNNLNLPGNKYSVKSGRGGHPENYTTWYNAIRFANWLNNGQGTGDTETGAYTLLGGAAVPSNGNSITRNAGAKVFLPSMNEWYKAAFYNANTSSYYRYPTSSNIAPTASGPTALANHANIVLGGPNNLTDVGAYTGTTSPYGVFDMGGNVWQWNEILVNGVARGYRGGSFATNSDSLRSTSRINFITSTFELNYIGFRVAMVPEPSSDALAGLAFGGLAAWAWRRRKQLGPSRGY